MAIDKERGFQTTLQFARDHWGDAAAVDEAHEQLQNEGVLGCDEISHYFGLLSERVEENKNAKSESVVSLDMAKATRGAGHNHGQQNQQGPQVAQLG